MCAVRLTMILFLPFLLSCSTDENIPLPEERPLVKVLFSPNKLGDHSYNDDILSGLSVLCNSEDLRLQYHILQNMEDADSTIHDWLECYSDEDRHYLIFAGEEFEPSVRRTCTGNFRDNCLLFDHTATDLPLHTFHINGYGASFLIGLVAYEMTKADTVAYIGGHRGNALIEECHEGFKDGFVHAGGKDVRRTYIAGSTEGFFMPSRAYILADSLFALSPFIYSMSGSSNMGIYQYLREHPDMDVYTNGVITDQAAYSERIVLSIIQEVGQCACDYVRCWSDGVSVPNSQTYDLPSGYTSVKVAKKYENRLQEFVNDNYGLAMKMESSWKEKQMSSTTE